MQRIVQRCSIWPLEPCVRYVCDSWVSRSVCLMNFVTSLTMPASLCSLYDVTYLQQVIAVLWHLLLISHLPARQLINHYFLSDLSGTATGVGASSRPDSRPARLSHNPVGNVPMRPPTSEEWPTVQSDWSGVADVAQRSIATSYVVHASASTITIDVDSQVAGRWNRTTEQPSISSGDVDSWWCRATRSCLEFAEAC